MVAPTDRVSITTCSGEGGLVGNVPATARTGLGNVGFGGGADRVGKQPTKGLNRNICTFHFVLSALECSGSS